MIPAAPVELERAVEAALRTYSNVHRGSGHKSATTSALLEQARKIVLEYLGWNDGRHTVVFCTPVAAARLQARLEPGRYRLVSSEETGLPLGIRALAVETRALPPGPPIQSGGGTVKFVLPRAVLWADAPDRFEAGTPAIINAITLAKALQIKQTVGLDALHGRDGGGLTAGEILHNDELGGLSGRELLHRLRQAVMGCRLHVPTHEGPQPCINLDHAVSTPALSPVWKAVRQTWRQPQAVRRELIDQVREIVAGFLGAPLEKYDILFTGNTTEAINLAAGSFGRRAPHTRPEGPITPVVLTTIAEHHSNELPWRYLDGVKVLRLPVDTEGFVDLFRLEELLAEWNGKQAHGGERIRLVAVSGASNVLGAIDDIEGIGRLAHRYGARILVDAAQQVAHRPIDMVKSEIDYLAFSAHKMYAPFGSGALVARKGLLHFEAAEWEALRAGGEENVAGIAALGKAIVLLQHVGLEVIEEHERGLTRRVLEGLARIPGIKVYGVQNPRSARFQAKGPVITFGLAHIPHNRVAAELAEEGGIGVRHGCFCAHLLVRQLLRIPPLLAKAAELGMILFPRFMGAVLPGLVRVSLGLENDESDVDHLLRTLNRIAARPGTVMDRLLASLHSGTPFLPRSETQARMAAFSANAVRRVFSPPPTGTKEPPGKKMVGGSASEI
jgi:selenocysteine lyase/cysteine desulfurase